MARNWDTFINKSTITSVSASLVLSCLASEVFAGGFQLQEQNVTNLGLAYSGTAALAEDASTGYYNAAGLTRLGESQIVIGANIVIGDLDFTASSSNVSFSLGNFAVPGDTKDEGGRTVTIPTLHVAKRIDDHWVFGFNVTSPFGLADRYANDGVVRYIASNTELQTINFSPELAYEFSSCFAFGMGIDAEFAKASLDARIGGGIAALDGFQKNHAEGWGYGFHAGVLWTPRYTTRVGLNYRSHVNLHTEGNSENLVPYNSLFGPAQGVYSIQRVRADVTVPETWTLSLYHAFAEKFAITADAAWTNWSRFHTLKLRFSPGSALPLFVDGVVVGTTPGLDTDTWEHFKDARRYALGLIYNYDPHWLFRIGTAYDETPTRNEFRTARIPDEDRIWLAIGGAYTFCESLRVDFGYAHIFFSDASLNERAPFGAYTDSPVTQARLAGKFDVSVNIVGIQIRYDFV